MNTTTRTLLLLLAAALPAACSQPATPDGALVDVAQAAARQTDRVNVEDLAGWLIEDRRDFVLIDVRSATDYGKGHIGEARNIAIAQLVTGDTLATLPADRRIVVYSNGSENGAKAATLLRLVGLDALVLSGGYNAWHARILNPDISAEALDGESLRVSAQRAYACYFVGDRDAGSAERPAEAFVPPVFSVEEDVDDEPLPPVGEESC